MLPNKIISITLLLLVLLVGCVPRTMQRRINKRVYEPLILHSSEIVQDKLPATVQVRYVDETGLGDLTNVKRDKWFFIYLLVFYHYDYDMTLTLGNKACSPSATYVANDVLGQTMARSGTFTISSDTNKITDYKAIITLNKVNVHCQYNVNGTAIGSHSFRAEHASAAIGELAFNVKLFDAANNLVFNKDYADKQSSGYDASTGGVRQIKYKAMQNMVETLTQSVQQISQQITTDMNAAVRK